MVDTPRVQRARQRDMQCMAENETSCIATAASTLVHQLHPQQSDLTKVRALLRQFQGLDYVRTIPNSV